MQSKTEYITSPELFYNVMYSDTNEVNRIVLLDNGNMAQVTCTELKETVTPLPYGNVIVASCVTAHGRLRLYEMLDKLKTRVLYHDTDSIIYKTDSVNDEEIPTGSSLGQWEDECKDPESDWLIEFVSIGPKSYAYRTHSGKIALKCKGITLTDSVKKQIHVRSMKEIVLDQTRNEVVVHPRRITRDAVFKQLRTVSVDKSVLTEGGHYYLQA